jgi:post-segregation antitoxin (ccd killing protein)
MRHRAGKSGDRSFTIEGEDASLRRPVGRPAAADLHTKGMLVGMAKRTKRTTLTLDVEALDLAERVARLRGISVSALASRAIRNEALRLGAPRQPTGSERDAMYDETERAAMEQDDGKQGGWAA